MKVVVTGGASGGHLYPALAIIEQLKKRESNLEILYIGTTNKIESKVVPSLNIDYIGIEMRGVNRKNIFKNLTLPFLLVKNFLKLKKIYKEFDPDIVIGTGGYVTVPVVKAASSMKIPTLIFDADYNFGMATRYLIKQVDCVCTGYNKESNDSKIVYTGNPRGQIVYEQLKYNDSENKVLYVFGSLGSETINSFFLNYFNSTTLNHKAKYVTGKGMYDDFKKRLTNDNVEVVEYIEDITKELGDVSFVVCRGGATSVGEFCACEIPAIYIPSPYVSNNEQVYNVEFLVEDNASLVIEEFSLTNELFDEKVRYMEDNYEEIKRNIAKHSVKNSADLIVENVYRLIGS